MSDFTCYFEALDDEIMDFSVECGSDELAEDARMLARDLRNGEISLGGAERELGKLQGRMEDVPDEEQE